MRLAPASALQDSRNVCLCCFKLQWQERETPTPHPATPYPPAASTAPGGCTRLCWSQVGASASEDGSRSGRRLCAPARGRQAEKSGRSRSVRGEGRAGSPVPPPCGIPGPRREGSPEPCRPTSSSCRECSCRDRERFPSRNVGEGRPRQTEHPLPFLSACPSHLPAPRPAAASPVPAPAKPAPSHPPGPCSRVTWGDLVTCVQTDGTHCI